MIISRCRGVVIFRRRHGGLQRGRLVRLVCLAGLFAGACTAGEDDESVPCPPSRQATVGGAEEGPQIATLPGRFAYHDAGGSLWIVEGNGEGRRRLTDPPEGAFDFDPDWAPDGRRIVYRRDFEGASGSVERSEVRVVGIDCRDTLVRPGSFPAWSPDGRWIALTAEKGIVSVRPDGARERVLDASGECATWSPVRGRMAYCSNDFDSPLSDDWDVIVMATDGSDKQQLTDDPGREYPYAWSPDASQIAFTSDRHGAVRVWIMDADGSEQRRLTDLESDYETVVAWLRTSNQLLLPIDSPADGLRGWYLASPSGELFGRIDVLPAEICCGEGQVAYWEPAR
jgi:dipeptidyl aminopeptidase/acylaminoacyl peptidase